MFLKFLISEVLQHTFLAVGWGFLFLFMISVFLDLIIKWVYNQAGREGYLTPHSNKNCRVHYPHAQEYELACMDRINRAKERRVVRIRHKNCMTQLLSNEPMVDTEGRIFEKISLVPAFKVHKGRARVGRKQPNRRPGPRRSGRGNNSNNNNGNTTTAVMHMQRSLRPMRNPVHSYSRMASYLMPVYQNGFNGTYNDMSFNFGLTAIQQWSGGALITSIPIPGSGDFQNLYSLWKLTGVETSILFSCNVAQVESVSVATYTLPIIYYATVPNSDYKSVAPTLTTIEQNQQCRVCQLGNIRSASGLTFGFKPVLPEDPNGVLVNNKSWVDINTGAEYYNSLQMVLDPFGATSAVFLGYMKLSFRLHYSLVNSG